MTTDPDRIEKAKMIDLIMAAVPKKQAPKIIYFGLNYMQCQKAKKRSMSLVE